MMTVYAGTAKETVDQVIDMIVKEFRDLKETLVTEEELRRAKNHLKGSLMLSLESTSSRMSNLARQELYFRRFFSLDEILAGIETVTREEIQSIAREFFRPEKIAVTALGPLNGFTLDRSRLPARDFLAQNRQRRFTTRVRHRKRRRDDFHIFAVSSLTGLDGDAMMREVRCCERLGAMRFARCTRRRAPDVRVELA